MTTPGTDNAGQMKLLRPISLLASLLITTAGAIAQTSLPPTHAQPQANDPAEPAAASKKEAPKAKAPTAAKKSTATPTPSASPLKPAVTTKPGATRSATPSPSPT